MLRVTAVVASFVIGAGSALAAVPAPIGPVAGPNPLAALGLRDGDIFVPTFDFGDESVHIEVTLDGQEHTLTMDLSNQRADSFQVYAAREGGVLEPVEVAAPKTYRGRVDGEPTSVVAGSIIAGRFTGTIHMGGKLLAIQPLDGDTHVSFSTGDVLPVDAFCGVNAAFNINPDFDPGAQGDSVGTAEICIPAGLTAFDADNEFFIWSGGSIQATVDQIEMVMNAVNVIYQRDIPSSHLIGEMIIRTTADDPYSGDIFQRLDQFQSEWNSQQSGIDRHLAHLFSGAGFDGVIGLAYVGVPCVALDFSYGVSISNFSNDIISRTALTAHEIGHNWGAGHCDGDDDCGIMCSGIGGCAHDLEHFGAASRNSIQTFVNAVRGCLDEECIDGQPPASDIFFGNTLSGEIGTLDANGGFVPFTTPEFNTDGMAYDRNRKVYLLTDTRDSATLFIMREFDFHISPIGPIQGASRIAGLAFDPNTDRLYGIDQAIGQLYLLTPELNEEGIMVVTAQAIGVRAGGLMGGLAFDENANILYGVDDLGGTKLYTLDTNTGQRTLIGSLGLQDCDGLCWRLEDETLYTIDGPTETLYSVDRTTGAAEPITQFRGFGIASTFGLASGTPGCLPDLNGDGQIDAEDFFTYLDLFVAGDSRADLTGSDNPNDDEYGVPDGSIDASDFFFFLDLFVIGCP